MLHISDGLRLRLCAVNSTHGAGELDVRASGPKSSLALEFQSASQALALQTPHTAELAAGATGRSLRPRPHFAYAHGMVVKLFPQISPKSITPALIQSPFLDLEWNFCIDLKELKRVASHDLPTSDTGLDFPTYLAKVRASRSPLLKALEAADSIEEGEFSELQIYVNYVIGLRAEDASAAGLIESYRRFTAYVADQVTNKPEALVADSVVMQVLLLPVLKWQEHRALLQESGKAVIAEMERAIDAVSGLLKGARFDPTLLEFQNTLIFCYLVVAEILEIGLSANVLAHHLRVHRFASPTRWAATPSRVRMQYAAVLLRFMLYFYRPEKAFRPKHGLSMNVLADLRSMFEDAAGSDVNAPFTSHQWVFRWFKDKLDAEVFSSIRSAGLPSSLAVLSDGEQSLAVELGRRFGSYRSAVTVSHLERFLLQFGTTQRIRGALRLLSHVKFYPLWELAASIEKQLATELTATKSSHLVIAPFGNQTGSTAIINYLASHSALEGQLKFAQDLPTALANTADGDSIYFVDDCLLSGTQTLNILGDLMGTRKRKPHHTVHCPELSEENKSKLLTRHLRFVYSLITDVGERRFREEIGRTGIDTDRTMLLYSVLEHSTSKAFEPLGPVGWASAEERDELKTFCTDVGYNILARRGQEKDWNDARRRESALGFSDFQRLLVFPYNVPKTTVTLLWERGTPEFAWQPLFPGFD